MNLTFANPALLPGLLLIAAPLLVHLLARTRPRPYAFSSVELIKRIQKRTTRLRRPRDWFLLLLRTLLVIALLGLFLQPTLFLAGVPGSQPRTVIVLVDASLSMRATEGGRSRFAAATAEAAQILDGLGTEDRANILFLRRPPVGLFPEPGVNHRFLKEALRKATCSWELGIPETGIRQALHQLKDAPGAKEIVWISDFQAATLKQDLPPLPEDVQLVRIPVGETTLANQAVTAITLDPPRPLGGEEMVVLVEVAQYSDLPGRVDLTLSVGAELHRQAISLAPWTTETVAFPVTMPAEGRVPLRAWIAPDAFPADNERTCVAPVVPYLTVGVVGSDTPEAARWQRALDALTWVKTIPVQAETLADTSFDALLVLDSSEDLLPDLQGALTQGTLILYAPPARSAPAPQTFLGTDTPPLNWVLERDARPLTLTQPDHPLFAVYREGRHGDPASASVRGRHRTAAPLADPAQPLLVFDDRESALTWWPGQGERAGTLVWWNIPLHPDHSDLAGRIEFLPLLGELLLKGRPLIGTAQTITAITPGDPLSPPNTPGTSAAWTWSPAGGTYQPYEEGLVATRPGWVTWQRDGKDAGRSAINAAPAESDLRIAENATTADGSGTGITLADGASYQRAKQGIALWPWCLAAAALLIILEGLASRWALAHIRDTGEAAA